MKSDQFRGKDLEVDCWEPGAPDSKYRGVLRVDDANNGSLRLEGPADSLNALEKERLVLFGIVKSNYFHRITIFDVVMTHSAIPRLSQDDISAFEAEFVTNNILIGAHINCEDDSAVNSALFILSGLPEWCTRVLRNPLISRTA